MADSETTPEKPSGRVNGEETDMKNSSGSNVTEEHSEETSQHHQQEHHEGLEEFCYSDFSEMIMLIVKTQQN